MHSRFLGLMAVFLAGAGWASAQVPSSVQFPPAPSNGPATTGMPNGQAVLPADTGGAVGGPVFYGSADYLLWQIRKGRLPNSTTSAPVGLISVNLTDEIRDPNGVLIDTIDSVGFAPVSIVNQATFGGEPFTNVGSQNGGRFGFGFWADPDQTFGMEASFFFLERGSDRFAAVSSNPGNQFILDTGFQEQLFLQTTSTVVTPNGTTQTVTRTLQQTFDVFVPRQATSALVGNSSVSLYGFEVNARSTLCRIGWFDFGGLAGFRYLNFKDELAVANSVRLFRPEGLALVRADASFSLSQDLNFSTVDSIRVWNYFYGGQAGIDFGANCGPVFFTARVKAAVGNMHQVAKVASVTSVINNDPVRPVSPAGFLAGGGLLASPADNGRHSRDRFAFIPEGSFKLGFQFTDWLRGYVGYDVILLGHAARAGASTTVNTLATTVTVADSTVNANIAQPTFRFRDQDVWVQGLTFGVEARY